MAELIYRKGHRTSLPTQNGQSGGFLNPQAEIDIFDFKEYVDMLPHDLTAGELPQDEREPLALARSKLPIATGVGGVGAGYLLAQLSSHNWDMIIAGSFQLADKHGPFALFSFLLVAVAVGLAVWLMRETIHTKEREIERLVKERNKFQEIVLRERRSTTDQ